jgi:4-alpha-glucanotransferase
MHFEKKAGVLVPVFALRSNEDLGVGDTSCVKEMIRWCALHKLGVLQVLPINETGDDNSPYNAISSQALDLTTITTSPEAIPDLSQAAFKKHAQPALLSKLREGPVRYREVKKLKTELLWEAYLQFLKKHDSKDTARAGQFREFILEQAEWIHDYALFRTLMELNDNLPLWEQWPVEHRSPGRARSWWLSQPATLRSELEDSVFFYCYVQWIAWQQWREVRDLAQENGLVLMGDIPFGIGRYSADVWANPGLFDLRWSCGAPAESFFKPDLFTEKWGQNWGIPLYRWDRMAEDNFQWWRNRVSGTCEIFQAFRIDHVLGFYRVYAFPWKPEQNGDFVHLNPDQAREKAGDLPKFWPGGDDDPHQRWLNEQHGEKLLRMILEAAGNSTVVAEDLGLVPDYVRPSLLKLGIPGFKIPMFDRNPDGSYQDSSEYPPVSIATLATHDHEPMASLWNKWSLENSGEKEKKHLLEWAEIPHFDPSRPFDVELHAAICRKLLASPSRFVIFMITDLFGTTLRFNVPGPMSESNWTERLSLPISQWDTKSEIEAWVDNVENSLPR